MRKNSTSTNEILNIITSNYYPYNSWASDLQSKSYTSETDYYNTYPTIIKSDIKLMEMLRGLLRTSNVLTDKQEDKLIDLQYSSTDNIVVYKRMVEEFIKLLEGRKEGRSVI